MKNWIKSNLRKPPQGKKVLCFDAGDLTVRQRFKDSWFPIPFVDSKLACLNQPEMWQEIDFPPGFTGYLRVGVDGRLLTLDELEKYDKDLFDQMYNIQIEYFNQTRQCKADLQ